MKKGFKNTEAKGILIAKPISNTESDPFIEKTIKIAVASVSLILLFPGFLILSIIIATNNFSDVGSSAISYTILDQYLIPIKLPSSVLEIIQASVAAIPFFLIRICYKPHTKNEPLLLNSFGKALIIFFIAGALLSIISLIALPNDPLFIEDLPKGKENYEILKKSCEVTFTYSTIYLATLFGFKREDK